MPHFSLPHTSAPYNTTGLTSTLKTECESSVKDAPEKILSRGRSGRIWWPAGFFIPVNRCHP